MTILSLKSDASAASISEVPYVALVLRLFPPLRGESLSVVLAFTSVNSGEGVSHVLKCVLSTARAKLGALTMLVEMEQLKSQHLAHPEQKMFEDDQPAWQGGWDGRRKLIEDLRAEAEIVAIDCPALNASADVLSLAPLLDGVVLVVEANRTKRAAIQDAERRIEAAGGKVVGLILNKTRKADHGFIS